MTALLSSIAKRSTWSLPPMQRFPVISACVPRFQYMPHCLRSSPQDIMCFSSRISPAFDTHDLVKRLTASGFTAEQAEVVLESMKRASEQYANTADTMYPTKIEMIEKNLAYKADFAAMKSDLVLMLKQDVALLKNEIHKLETVIGKETTAYQTKLEQLENKSIKYVFGLLASSFGLAITAFGVYRRLSN